MATLKFTPHQPQPKEHAYDLVQAQAAMRRSMEDLSLGVPTVIRTDQGDIKDIALVAGNEQWVEHGLGRAVRGYIVLWQTAPAILSVVDGSDADLTRFLPLSVTQDVTVRLGVY